MSKTPRRPFFARFIETEPTPIDTKVRAGEDGDKTWSPIKWPPEPTKKYPSDQDDEVKW